MPRFGTYTARRVPVESSGASFSVPGEKRSPVTVPRTEEVVWAGARQAAGTVQDIAVRMRNASMAQELSAAQVESRKVLADIDAQLQDPDFLSQYDPDEHEKILNERAGEAWERISEGIKEDRVKRAARDDFEALRVSYLTRTRSRARQVQIESGRASTDQQLRELQEVLLRGDAEGDTRAVADALVTAEGIVSGKVSAGFFSAEEGDVLLENFHKNATGTIWARRIQNDPAGAFIALTEAKSIPNMLESERVTLQKMAKAAYESMLRTRVYAANLQDRQDQKALKLLQEQTASGHWVEIQNGRYVSQGALDKDLMLQRLDLDEYRALSAAARDPDGVTVDDPQIVLGIEQALDVKNFDKARQLAYGGIENGMLTNTTGIGYITTARSATASGISADRTTANQLLRTVFKQDGLLPDMTLNSRYRDATMEMIAGERQGKNPLAIAVDIFQREAGAVEVNVRDWPGGPVTIDSVKAYQQSLVERLQAGTLTQEEYSARYAIAQQALDDLKRNESMAAQVEKLKALLK